MVTLSCNTFGAILGSSFSLSLAYLTKFFQILLEWSPLVGSRSKDDDIKPYPLDISAKKVTEA